MTEKTVQDEFSQLFGKQPDILVSSPGRINIIGEHTDYNYGYVLPAAVDYHITLGIAKNNTKTCRVYSVDFDDFEQFELSDIQESNEKWMNFILGVVYQLKDEIGGFDLIFSGDIPVGAGLSSSAALSCGTAYALSHLFGLDLDDWQISKIAQKSEHDFVHVQCGIMDQFACMFGRENQVLLLDCEKLEYIEYEFDLTGHKLLLLDSHIKHELGSSQYNVRRKESAEALTTLQEVFPERHNFKNFSQDELHHLNGQLNSILLKRAQHIISENHRVHAACSALKQRDFKVVGQLLTESHKSLRDHYDVTCEETDFIVDCLGKEENIYGARQIGGGFGGCVLAIAKDEELQDSIDRVGQQYKARFDQVLEYIPIRISKGCHILE